MAQPATPNAIYTQQRAKPACQEDINAKFSHRRLAQLSRTQFTHSNAPNPHARKAATRNFRSSYWRSRPETNLHTALCWCLPGIGIWRVAPSLLRPPLGCKGYRLVGRKLPTQRNLCAVAALSRRSSNFRFHHRIRGAARNCCCAWTSQKFGQPTLSQLGSSQGAKQSTPWNKDVPKSRNPADPSAAAECSSHEQLDEKPAAPSPSTASQLWFHILSRCSQLAVAKKKEYIYICMNILSKPIPFSLDQILSSQPCTPPPVAQASSP